MATSRQTWSGGYLASPSGLLTPAFWQRLGRSPTVGVMTPDCAMCQQISGESWQLRQDSTTPLQASGELVCLGSPASCNVPPCLGPVLAVAAGQHHTCAITTHDQLVCFGGNQRGQCDTPGNWGFPQSTAHASDHGLLVGTVSQLLNSYCKSQSDMVLQVMRDYYSRQATPTLAPWVLGNCLAALGLDLGLRGCGLDG